MINFFKSRLPQDFFKGGFDIHSHLLPGVDDGFQTEKDTLAGLSLLKNLGYSAVTMTPHFMKDYPDNTRPAIEAKFHAFIEGAGKDCGLMLRLAGEYMLDSAFPQRMEEGFLTLDSKRALVLCETSYMMVDPNAKQMLYDAMLKGYQPVIAHPERYQYASESQYKRWKEKDYLFQLNLLSLSGAYGELARKKAYTLLSQNYYDFVGTDLHRVKNVESMISSIKVSSKERDALQRLLENNGKLGL